MSERLLRFWHHQNQPIEVPHGRTLGGIYYPTRGGAAVFERASNGRGACRSITWETQHIGPTHIPDVFHGQVLSLHPLSGFFMKDAALCAIAGRFFASDCCDEVIMHSHADCREYWDLVGAILSAAHLYKREAARQAQRDGVRQRGGDIVKKIATSCETTSEAVLLEDFAEAQRIRCPRCRGRLILRKYYPAQSETDQFQVDYACRSCRQQVSKTFGRKALTDWLSNR